MSPQSVYAELAVRVFGAAVARRWTVSAWLSPLLLLACLTTACSAPDAAPRRPRPLVVLGLDGATWEQIDPMIAAGELPHLAALSRRGVRGDLICLPPLSSPVVWTTFATGHFGRTHNILDHTYPYVAGPKRKITARLRRSPTLWDVASAANRRVDVFGYFASHPPVEVNGTLVSDRAATGPRGATFPASLADELMPQFQRLNRPEVLSGLWDEYFPWPFDQQAVDRPDDPYHRVSRVVSGRIDRQIRREEFFSQVALERAGGLGDLFVVYLRMIDHASHATWEFFDPESFDPPPASEDVELLRDLIPTAYRKADEFLGLLLAEVGPDVNLVVISDHGFGPATGPWRIRRDGFDGVSGNHRPNGIFLAAGPDIVPGAEPGSATVFGTTARSKVTAVDIAPTLFALLDLPISEELPGRPEMSWLSEEFLGHFPLRSTPRYLVPWTFSAQDGDKSLEEEREELRLLEALGYLQGSPEVAAPEAADSDVDFWSIDPRIRNQALIGELLHALIRADEERFDALVRDIEQRAPDLHPELRRVIRRQMEIWQQAFPEPIFASEALGWVEAAD